ncbi:hypothetical protein VTK56DRAFT_6886 [Thermocarpiscus australiensis]
MSLNGLDDPRLKEAHETAVAEPGGWFLLKYASRDEVELLGRGNGGIVEMRSNIAQYEEKSPLYGFLRYRRRNVIIKYLPEDCSRLVQARVTVHFDAVCDRFSPYDTTFSITDSKELKDSKLSAACSLHAASGSTSSSTSSLRRRRLMEIAEEEEEEERERKRQSLVKEEKPPQSSAERQILDGAPAAEPPVKLDADLAKSPEASRFSNELDPPHFTGVPRPSSPAKSFDEASRRTSSQSSRQNLYPTVSYPYLKPRVKLAPRPSADLNGRPRSSAGSAAHRPVSTVPAGLKSLSKGSKKGRVPDQDGEGPESPIKEEAEDPFLLATAADSDAKPVDNELDRPHTSSGVHAAATSTPAVQINTPALAPPQSKQSGITPEKARLLKAMKLREKKKMMSLQPALDLPAVDVSSEPSTPGLPDESRNVETPADVAPVEDAPNGSDAQHEDRRAIVGADSAIETDVGTDHASVETRTDSHPASPLAASDVGDSTLASSLSESTDETVLAKNESSDPADEVGEGGQVAAMAQGATSWSEGPVDGKGHGRCDGQSEERIAAVNETGGDKEVHRAELQGKVEERGSATLSASDKNEATQPLLSSASSEVQPPSGAPENETIDAAPAGTVTETRPASNAPEGKKTENDPAEAESAPPAPIRIPLSKFSTQEARSPAGASKQSIPSIVAHTPDVESWRVAAVAPPVPEKDNDLEAGESAGNAAIESGLLRRRLPLDPIRTDLDGQENDKRRSVISILSNDGLMDELQSATVQQATPITVSKSPINPVFPADPSFKRAPGGSEVGAAAPRFLRTSSNPVPRPLSVPGDAFVSTARSVSSGSAYLQKNSQPQAPADLRPKSAKLGSSISQRIKALEKLSGSANAGDMTPKERPATTFFAVRKAATRETSRPPSVVDRANSLTSKPTSSPPPESRDSSPEASRVVRRDRSGSLVNRLSMFEGGMPPRGRPESIQVTARIVRDPNQPFPKVPETKAGSTEYAPLDLKQSPLLVNVQNRAPSQSPVRPPNAPSARPEQEMPPPQNKLSLLERRLSKGNRSQSPKKEESKEGGDGRRPRRRSSLSVVKDFIKDRTESLIGAKSPSTDNHGLPVPSASTTNLASPAVPTPSRSSSRPPSVHQNASLTRRLSISSRRSSIEQNSPAGFASGAAAPSRARTPDAGAESETEVKSSGSGEKKPPTSPNQSKGSRASRFMRRLSSSLVTSRKNTAPSISPTVAEENAAEVEAASRGSTATSVAAHTQPSIVAFMGDVNVQFPDNLLWKRRSICLDSQGFLILSSLQGTAMLPIAAPGKDGRQGPMVKRYHMSDFKPPYAPDVELQELPNSVVLDFVDGSGLQIACEDRAGQMNILHILQEAHRHHTSFGH